MVSLNFSMLDWLSIGWFLICWVGYTHYSGYQHREKPRLQEALYAHIRRWIDVLQTRENRIVDTSIIANIERNAAFLASSTLLIIAGLVTTLGASDKITVAMASLPFTLDANPYRAEIGIIMLLIAFIYAFFTFTWCLRQWGFASILIGSVPNPTEALASTQQERHCESLAKVVWLAVYHFNAALRAYYFSLALLAWFIHPVVFMLASTWVVAVLYRREFHSKTLTALLTGLPK